MSRPKISVETFEADLAWFGEHGQRQWFARLGHAVVAHRQRPHVTASPGADRVIESLLGTDTRLVLAANHPTGPRDTEVIAAVPQCYEPLKPIIGSTKIMAAAKLFEAKNLQSWLRAHVMTALGAYPVINTDLYPDLDEETRQVLRDVHTRFSAGQLVNGWHLATFPEGDKDRTGNPTKVRDARPGIQYIMDALPQGVMAAIVPIGMSYHDEAVRVHVGDPIHPSASVGLLQEVQQSLQDCVDTTLR